MDFATGSTLGSIAVGDLNGDGKPDLVVTRTNSNAVSVLLNTTAPGAAAPSVVAKVDFATGSARGYVAVADLNRHGKPDLAVANLHANTIDWSHPSAAND